MASKPPSPSTSEVDEVLGLRNANEAYEDLPDGILESDLSQEVVDISTDEDTQEAPGGIEAEKEKPLKEEDSDKDFAGVDVLNFSPEDYFMDRDDYMDSDFPDDDDPSNAEESPSADASPDESPNAVASPSNADGSPNSMDVDFGSIEQEHYMTEEVDDEDGTCTKYINPVDSEEEIEEAIKYESIPRLVPEDEVDGAPQFVLKEDGGERFGFGAGAEIGGASCGATYADSEVIDVEPIHEVIDVEPIPEVITLDSEEEDPDAEISTTDDGVLKRRPGSRGPPPGRGGRALGKRSAGETRSESNAKKRKNRDQGQMSRFRTSGGASTNASTSSMSSSSIPPTAAARTGSSSDGASSLSRFPPTSMASSPPSFATASSSSSASIPSVSRGSSGGFPPSFNSSVPPPGFRHNGYLVESQRRERMYRHPIGGVAPPFSVRSGWGSGYHPGSRGGWGGFIADRSTGHQTNRGAKLVAISVESSKFFIEKQKKIHDFLGNVAPFDNVVEKGDYSGYCFATKIVAEDVALGEIRRLNQLRFEGAPVHATLHTNTEPTKFPPVIFNLQP